MKGSPGAVTLSVALLLGADVVFMFTAALTHKPPSLCDIDPSLQIKSELVQVCFIYCSPALKTVRTGSGEIYGTH